MKPHPFVPASRRPRRRGFTLMEMLIVLTVLGILLAIASPNLFQLMQASTLTSEGSMLRNKLTQAQQLALSKNTDVEVRFFKMADATAAEVEQQFRAFQFFQFDETGKLVPVSKFFRIKPPVVISERFSTLLNTGGNQDADGKKYGYLSPSRNRSETPVGGDEVSSEYISFRFRPDGSTDLPGRSGSSKAFEGGDTWYITLLQGTDTNGLPPNFYTVQVDPFNGRIGVYRP